MKRVVPTLTRPILVLTALMISIAAFIQPTPLLRAQEIAPPPPTASVGPDLGVDQAAPQLSVGRLDPADGSPIPPPDRATTMEARPSAKPSAPAASTGAPQEAGQPAPVNPQATNLTPFLINIVASTTARADSDLTYTIYFTNTSPTETYHNVLLQDGIGVNQFFTACVDTSTCPFTYTGDLARPTLLSVTGIPANSDGRELVWSLGNVTPGQKGRISYTVRVRYDIFPRSGQSSRVLGNTVALYKDGAITTSNKLNEDQWGVLVVGPVFYMTKTGTPYILLEGDRIDYTIRVGNATGPGDSPGGQIRSDARTATQISIIDLMPQELENIQPQDGGTYDSGTRLVTWNLPGTLAPNDFREVHVSATIKNDLLACGGMTNNRFAVTSAELPYDPGHVHYYVDGQVGTTSYVYPPATVILRPTPPGVKVGEQVSWEIEVDNYWKTAISGATVKFTLPPDFSYDGVSNPPGTYDGLTKSITWSNVTLPAKTDFDNPSRTKFTVQSHAGRKIDANTGFGEVTLPQGIPNGCLRPGTFNVNVDPVLFGSKSVDKSLVLPGSDVVYTVQLSNISGQVMNDVSLVDTLPAINHGASYLYNFVYKNMVSGPAPTVGAVTPGVPQTLRWNNLVVPAGTPSNPGRLTLSFRATANGIPRDCVSNSIQPDSSISQARRYDGGQVCIDFPWTVEKTVNRRSIPARDTNRLVEYTIKYVSHVNTAQAFTPGDGLPYPGQPYAITFVRMLQGPDGTTKPNPISTTPDRYGFIYWPQDTLPANGTVYYKFEALLPVDQNGLLITGGYCNEGDFFPEPRAQYGYYIYYPGACLTVSSIEMRVFKEVFPNVVGLGHLVTYAISLDNRSSDTVGSVVVSDTLPVNMPFVGSATGSLPPNVTTLPSGQQLLTWNGVVVPGNSRLQLIYNARAPALIGNVLNVAEVTGGNPAPYYNCDNQVPSNPNCATSINLTVENRITIDPSVAPAKPLPGGVVTYTLTLASVHNAPYENVIVTDTLPVGVDYLDSVEGSAPTEVRPGVLVWRNQTVPSANEGGRLRFVFRAGLPLGYGTFCSRFEATSSTGVIPPADNAACVLVAPQSPALSLFATPLVEPGGDVTFKISLVNPDITPLTAVTITEPLPDGFNYISTTTTLPPTTISGQTLIWSGLTVPGASGGSPGIIEITFHATAPMMEGIYTDTVTATGSREIDHTYNTRQIIVAQLNYLYLPLIMQEYVITFPPP